MKKCLALLCTLAMLLTGCLPGTEREATPETPAAVGTESSSQEEGPEPDLGQEAEPEPEPEESLDWEFDTPENHGMDGAVLERMHEALPDAPVYAVVTVRDGVIVDEYYREGYDETSVYEIHSCSKSFTSALFGIALEEGDIEDIHDPLWNYLPQVLGQEDTRKQDITLEHLLTHTSGLEWDEWDEPVSTWWNFRSSANWVDFILGRELVSEPGSAFAYSTGGTHLLAAALENATGKSLADYGQEKLFGPLGMESVSWGSDPQGITDGGNGLVMNARDAAKLGQLYLDGGMWQGEQIVPTEWVEESTTVKNNGEGDGTGSYGYQWWIRSFGAQGYRCYYAFGAFGQYILAVPDLDLVVVITSFSPQDSYAPRRFFTEYILPVCVE